MTPDREIPDSPAPMRSEITAGTASAVPGSTRATSPTAPTHAGENERHPSNRRGVVLGLLTAGAAAAAGATATLFGRGTPEATSQSVAPTGRTIRSTITVRGMRFVPATVQVNPGDRLILTLNNSGDQVHDLVLDTGATTGRLAAGASGNLDAGIITGPIEGWCSLPGHRAQGMVLRISTTSADHHSGEPMSHGEAPASDIQSITPDFEAPLPQGFTPWEAALAPAPHETLHRVTLTVTEEENACVGAGLHQTRWTYNGTAPGPTLRGHVGDTFEVTLINEGSMSHSIDFHASLTAPDEVMRSINPGEKLTYTFTAQHSGIWLYHCSTMPMSVHLASGMFGAVIIDPPGLAPVDREFVLVQSEIYLAADGSTDPAKVAAKTPDLLAFNGAAFQYVHAPLQAKAGERVRFWVLDAGPSLPSSFHIVGLQFDTVFFEGTYLLGGPDGVGRAWQGGSQALALAPAQGGFVEAVIPAAGHYPVVTHAFADAEKGAKAILRAT